MDHRNFWLTALALGASLLVVSCNNIPDCDNPNTSAVVIQFRDSTNTESMEEIFSSIYDLDSNLEFVSNDTLSLLSLDVDPTDTVMRYVFESDDLLDTLVISYRQNILLRSEQCGPVLRQIDLMVVEHTFTDTFLQNNELLQSAVNIQIVR